jgi:hypothetical protein
MTVRLLQPYGKYPKNANLTTGAATEDMLLRTGQADTNTAAGTTYVDPVPTERSGPPAVESTGGVDVLRADGRELLNLSAAQALVSQYGISDEWVDHVSSGMVLPTSGPLVNNITAGVAYLQGAWVAFTGTTVTLTASRDNYIDALPDGTYSVQPVTNGGAAPAVAVNGLRLGYVVTGASTVSSATTTGRDSLGNWMGNRVRVPACYLGQANTQALTGGSVDNFISFASAALEQLDNAQMHSVTTNPTRLTAPRAGLYRVNGWATWLISSSPGAVVFTVRKQGGSAVLGMPIDTFTANGIKYSASTTGDIYLGLGEFIELRIQVGTGISLTNAGFSAVWVG